MRSAAWFIVSELLLVMLVALIFSNWQGNVNFALGWPLNGCTLNITGGAHGGGVLLAFVSAILSLVAFVLGLVRILGRQKRTAPPANALTASGNAIQGG